MEKKVKKGVWKWPTHRGQRRVGIYKRHWTWLSNFLMMVMMTVSLIPWLRKFMKTPPEKQIYYLWLFQDSFMQKLGGFIKWKSINDYTKRSINVFWFLVIWVFWKTRGSSGVVEKEKNKMSRLWANKEGFTSKCAIKFGKLNIIG